ncbi:hypothetical protein IRJ41_020488 [Triplophysa rosa]|uniref:Uncharacterized protein n=1 Tax=Triplophysa rosa TaxID=992332 RepID=A0A9W7WEM6_TRIRA|nr:hypothetical protein IRJ41_020488 [Triplophysa rosa]
MTRDMNKTTVKEPNVMKGKQRKKALGDKAKLTEKQGAVEDRAEFTRVIREHLKVEQKNSIDLFFRPNCKSFVQMSF